MNPLSRRVLLRSTCLVPVAGLALAGCSTVSAVASDATIIANGVAAVLPTIQTLVGLPAAVVAKVSAGVASIQSAASGLASAIGSGATTAAEDLSAGVSAVNTALTGFASLLPSWVPGVISAAETLAPEVLSLAGIAFAGPTDPRALAQARAILVAAAAS